MTITTEMVVIVAGILLIIALLVWLFGRRG
jgi:hypothetical protein